MKPDLFEAPDYYNLDDLLTSRPGGVVRTKQPPSQVMMPMQNQTISQQAFPLLEYLDHLGEVVVYPGEDELEALAFNIYWHLSGELKLSKY